MPIPETLYFAYGSNLCEKRFKQASRVPSASFVSLATLQGFRMVFHKPSIDGSGKATLILDSSSEVMGALFAYDAKDHVKLLKAEGGYDEHIVTVTTSRGSEKALTFICATQKLNPSLQPYDWYLDLILHGGRLLALPEKYLAQFADVIAKTDSDSERAAKERAFLEV